VTQGPRAPTPAPANAAARTAVVAALTPPRPPLEALGSPLRATRIGGFKGLAALGRVAGPASGPAAGTPSVALQGAARPQPATLDPQAVIDHVESALREQAGRSGVSIEGLEP